MAEFEEGLFFGLSSLENRSTFRSLLGLELGGLGVFFFCGISRDLIDVTLVEEATEFVVESDDEGRTENYLLNFHVIENGSSRRQRVFAAFHGQNVGKH